MSYNLEFIKSVEIEGNTTATSITNCFNANFDIYQFVVRGQTSVDTSPAFYSMRLIDSGGSVISDAEYDYANLYLKSNASYSENEGTGETSWIEPLGETDASPESAGAVVTIYNPYSSSSYTSATFQSVFCVSGVTKGGKRVAVHKVTETITGINIFRPSGSELGAGTFTVYGVK
tara:strand:- start:515 stop:1039 length:525 start_codon:yes stop_codon:yes gene_type:complete